MVSIPAVLVGACVLVGCRNEPATAGKSATTLPVGKRVRLYDERRPSLDFPPHVRSEDEAVNTFITDFYEACCLGEYDRFRLMMSTRVDPFTPERFKKALTAVALIRVEAVEKLPEVEDVPPPVYLVRSRVQLREDVRKEELERKIAILVFKETGRWVMAPAPKALQDGLDALYEEEPPTEAEQADAKPPAAIEANPSRGPK